MYIVKLVSLFGHVTWVFHSFENQYGCKCRTNLIQIEGYKNKIYLKSK